MGLRSSWQGLIAFCALLCAAPQIWAQQALHELQQRLAEQETRIRQLELNRLPPVDPLVSHYDDDDATTASLESRLAELERMLGNGPGGGKGGPLAGSSSSAKPTQSWTGRIHTDHWSFPGSDAGSNFYERGDVNLAPQGRFLFRRLRLGLAGDIFETMLYKIEFDFAEANDLAIKDAYIGWKELPLLQTVLLGNQKRPYGLDHLNSSRYNVFVERPFVVEAFNPDARRYGVCSYGVSDDEAYNWRYGAYLSTDIQDTGGYVTVDDPGKHSYQGELAGRLANTIWYDDTSDGRGYAHWAVSGTVALPDGTAGTANTARFSTRPEARTSARWIDTGNIAGADRYELLGLEGVINVGALQWVGEYMHAWVKRGLGNDLEFSGGYMYLSYFLTGEHEPWQRRSGTIGRVRPLENFFLVNRCCGGKGWGRGAWQLAARYSYGDFSDENILGGVGTSLTLGLNWWWTPHSRLQFNCIQGDIEQRGGGGPAEGEYTILGARFAADF